MAVKIQDWFGIFRRSDGLFGVSVTMTQISVSGAQPVFIRSN